jgi:hypothetical protein
MPKKIDTVTALRLVAETQADTLPHRAALFALVADELEALRAENKRLQKLQRDHIVLMRPADAARVIDTYGHLAELFTSLKARGWEKNSVDYVRARVWFE